MVARRRPGLCLGNLAGGLLTITTTRFWPRDKPIPPGWAIGADLAGCHHGHWSIIIVETDERGTPARMVNYWPRSTGEFCYTSDPGSEVITGLLFCCPCGCGDVSGIRFENAPPIAGGDPEGAGKRWTWDGNDAAPTLTPSLARAKGCKWHGWLRAGRFVPV